MDKRFSVVFFVVLVLLLPAQAGHAAIQGKHLFILSGQSNMTRPLADSFRASVQRVFGDDRVIVVRYGKPSQPIKRWYKGWQPPAGMIDDKPQDNGTLYTEMMNVVSRSVKDQPLETVTFIWMQGEADAGSGWGSVYEKSFLGVIEQIKADIDVQQVNFVVGRINEFWLSKQDGTLMRKVLKKLGEDHANGSWINTDDLNTGVNPWGGFSFEDGHYPPPGYRVMGQRFAKQACLLIDPALKDRAEELIPEDPIIDESADIKTHAAVGRAVRLSVQPEARHPGLNASSAALVDGKFGQADPSDRAWLAFKPSDQLIEWVVDLGTVIEIDTIAVSTLISSAAKAEFPKKLTYSTSLDGQTYQVHNSRYQNIHFYNGKQLRDMRAKGIEPTRLLLLTEQRTRTGKPKARYVKVQIETGDQRVLIDEIIVNPVAKPVKTAG